MKVQATVNIYDKRTMEFVDTFTGTMDELVDKVKYEGVEAGYDCEEKEPDYYFMLAIYPKQSCKMIYGTHFGVKVGKIGGLSISEAIYMNGFLNYMLREKLKWPIDSVYNFSMLYNRKQWFDERMHKADENKPEKFRKWLESFIEENTCFSRVEDLKEWKNINGIYMLVLEKYKHVYIGQSNNIKKRIQQHWRSDNYMSCGIDAFRAYDTTEIYAFRTKVNDTDHEEYELLNKIPPEYRMNYMSGGKIDFHIQNNISIEFDDEKEEVQEESIEEWIKRKAEEYLNLIRKDPYQFVVNKL